MSASKPNPIPVNIENHEQCGGTVEFTLSTDPTVKVSTYVSAGGTGVAHIMVPGLYGITAQMDAPCANPPPTTGDIQPPGPYKVVLDKGRITFS